MNFMKLITVFVLFLMAMTCRAAPQMVIGQSVMKAILARKSEADITTNGGVASTPETINTEDLNLSQNFANEVITSLVIEEENNNNILDSLIKSVNKPVSNPNEVEIIAKETITAVKSVPQTNKSAKSLLDASPSTVLEEASKFSAAVVEVDQSIAGASSPETVVTQDTESDTPNSALDAPTVSDEVSTSTITTDLSNLTAAAAPIAMVPILMEEREPIVGNAYGFRYRSGDGQYRAEKSAIKLPPPGVTVLPGAAPEYETVGEYHFTHPDGTFNRISYTSGTNGFVAHGPMIPTPPPMPVWAIEQIRFAEEQKRLQAIASFAKSIDLDVSPSDTVADSEVISPVTLESNSLPSSVLGDAQTEETSAAFHTAEVTALNTADGAA